MNFIPLDFNVDNSLSSNIDVLINISVNLFKMKYYYEEEAILSLNASFNQNNSPLLIIGYQEASAEIDIYLETISLFVDGVLSVFDNLKEYNMIIDFFNFKEKSFTNKIINEDNFRQWLFNKNYSFFNFQG